MGCCNFAWLRNVHCLCKFLQLSFLKSNDYFSSLVSRNGQCRLWRLWKYILSVNIIQCSGFSCVQMSCDLLLACDLPPQKYSHFMDHLLGSFQLARQGTRHLLLLLWPTALTCCVFVCTCACCFPLTLTVAGGKAGERASPAALACHTADGIRLPTAPDTYSPTSQGSDPWDQRPHHTYHPEH